MASSKPGAPLPLLAPRAIHRHDDDGGVVEIGIMRVAVLERPAAGTHVGPPLAPVAFHVQHLQRLQPAQPAQRGGVMLALRTSSSAWAASAVSQTGETQGWQ